jgi:hypothetical protein
MRTFSGTLTLSAVRGLPTGEFLLRLEDRSSDTEKLTVSLTAAQVGWLVSGHAVACNYAVQIPNTVSPSAGNPE